MMKRTAHYFWSLRREFAKYFLVGISAVAFDMGTLIAAKELLNIRPIYAVIINQLFVLAYVFFTNKYWSFRNTDLPHKQMARFIILATFNYFFSVFMMYIFNHHVGIDYRIVRMCTIAVMVPWNFFLYKYWVYKQEKQLGEEQAVYNFGQNG